MGMGNFHLWKDKNINIKIKFRRNKLKEDLM